MNTSFHWQKFREVRNAYNSKIKEAKIEAETRQANNLKNPETLTAKKWWKLAKSYIKKDQSQNSSYPPLKDNNDTVCDDKDKAELFNSFFLTHSTLDDSNVPDPDDKVTENQTLPNVEILEKDVSDIIKTLDTNKATGPDKISQKMLKEAGDSIAPSLTKLFNLSLNQAKYPSQWKKAHVLPVFKKGDSALIDNYRPVSILS